jgi:hypothetical protein
LNKIIRTVRYARNVQDGIGVAQSLVKNTQNIRDWHRKRNTYTISIPGKDYITPYIMEWLNEVISPEKQHALKYMYSMKSGKYIPVHDDNTKHTFYFKDIRVMVELQKETTFSDVISKEITPDEKSKCDQILFTVYSKKDQDILIEEVNRIRKEASTLAKESRLWTLSQNGSWMSNSFLPHRSLYSVVLPDGQLETIQHDMNLFLDSYSSYTQLGISWHRGYLFHGPPGTGKTSLAKALATDLKRDLYYLPLGSIQSDISLITAFSSIGPNSILLLEDVDVFAGMKDRHVNNVDNSHRAFTLSGLLNVLDGVMTPNGLMCVMTTNDISSLDTAILRPGRVDVIEKLDNLVEGQAEKIFKSFYGRYPTDSLESIGRSPAEIINVLKTHLHDPDLAEKAIREKREVKI